MSQTGYPLNFFAHAKVFNHFLDSIYGGGGHECWEKTSFSKHCLQPETVAALHFSASFKLLEGRDDVLKGFFMSWSIHHRALKCQCIEGTNIRSLLLMVGVYQWTHPQEYATFLSPLILCGIGHLKQTIVNYLPSERD